MQMLIYLIVGLSLTWLFYLLYMYLASKSIEGRRADELQTIIPALSPYPPKALIYCFSRTCGPCRSMNPLVDNLNQEGKAIYKVDIQEHAEVAKDIGVRGVPTLLLIEHGAITKVVLGAQNRTQIEALLS